jgi:hypothetical protein
MLEGIYANSIDFVTVTVFWAVMLFSVVEIYQSLKENFCIHLQERRDTSRENEVTSTGN